VKDREQGTGIRDQLRPDRLRPLLTIMLGVLVVVGCGERVVAPASAATAPTLAGDAAHPGHAQGWVDTRLYFGLGPADDPTKGVSEAAWRDFLDREVTPRFPDGLSVLDVYGQWQGKSETTPERIRTKLLVIDYADTPENRAKIDQIRSAWKQRTGDESVMKVTEPADVSF
jgi:hypothetical protein